MTVSGVRGEDGQRVIEFDSPIDPELNCRHCARPIVAIGYVVKQMTLAGYRPMAWVHKATAAVQCPPPDEPPDASPYDGYEATRRVTLIERAREKARDAYLDAVDGERWATADISVAERP